MTLAGVGAGINELTALAATSELAPTRKRGKYVAVLIFTIVPFCPSVLWGQLIASHAGWRYCGALCGAWAAVGLFMTLFFYFPPPRVNSKGLTNKEIISQIDIVGGILSISGMILFMAGLQWGGYQVSRVLSPCIFCLGIRARPCPLNPRCLSPHRLRCVGSQVCQIPHVPRPSQARSSYSRLDSRHHFHLRRKLLLHSHVLAHASVQRLRPGSSRRGHSRCPHRIQYLGRRLHRTLVVERVPWT